MFSKLAITVLVALVGLSGLHVDAAAAHPKGCMCCKSLLSAGGYLVNRYKLGYGLPGQPRSMRNCFDPPPGVCPTGTAEDYCGEPA
jgi:hypothetical protein